MRAATLEAPGRFRIREVPAPEPGPGQVRVRLQGTGVCASEIPTWEGRPWTEYPLPAGRPGHEGWGVVDALGDGVDSGHGGLEVGTRVAGLFGATYAEHDVADARHVVQLPRQLDEVSFPGEPVACALNALRRSDIRAGHQVAILGAGFIGLLLTRLATARGARVIVLSRRATALELARTMGADETVPLDDQSRALSRAAAFAEGDGYDRVIEATGHQWPLDLAGELTRVRGRLVVVGYHQDPRRVNMQLWNWKGIDVVNAHERDPDIVVQGLRDAIGAVLEGQIEPWKLLTHALPLDRVGRALELARTRPEGFLKAVVMP